MAKKISKSAYFLLIILIIASFFRLYNLTGADRVPPGLYPDEAMNGNNAIEALDTGNFKVYYPENNGREGLFVNIQALSVKIFGNTPFALRLPSAIFGILTVLGVYLLAAALFNNSSVGLLSALFMALSFWHINFSRIGFRAIMAPFLLVWASYLLIAAIKRNDTVNKPLHADHPSWLLAAFAGLIYGAGFYTYIAYRATPLFILVLLWVYCWGNKRKIDIWEVVKVFSLFTFICLLPFAAYFLAHPADFFGRTGQLSIFSSANPLKDLALNILKTAGMFNFAGDGNWRHNFAGQPELYWPVGIIFVFGILYGLWEILKTGFKHGKEFIILFAWLVIAALPVVISNEGIPHALRSILLIPAVFIIAGSGAYKIYEIIVSRIGGFCCRHPELIRNSFILLCAALIVQTYNYYFIEWGQNPNVSAAFNQDYVDMGNMLNSLPQSQLKYVVVETNGVEVRGIPMPAQTVMYITDTFTTEKQVNKNIHYILPGQEKDIFENDAVFFYLK